MPRKANVLAVDDNRGNLVALDAVLGGQYKLFLASSGEEALALLQLRPDIDVILMDVQMPGLDGFETAELIKQQPACRDIPIIFVTAVYTEDPFIKKGYEVGGIDYFTKPFDPEILKLKIGIYASHRLKIDLLEERERHLRHSEELLRVGRKLSSVLEDLPVGVLIADLDGRICQSTEQVARIFNCADASATYGEMLGWWDAGGQMIRDEQSPLARALRRGEVSHGERMQIRCLDGALKTVLVSASPLRSPGGERTGAVILIQDLTESRKLEEDLAQRVTAIVDLGVALEESAGREAG